MLLWELPAAVASPDWKVQGAPSPGLESVDLMVERFMQARDIPRGQVAIAIDGRLVYNRAFSWGADAARQPTHPLQVFRIASLSKPVTAIGIFRLIEQGRLQLDQRISSILDLSGARDPRLQRVTVRDLLQHSGGWDRDQAGDPMFQDRIIAHARGVGLPVSMEALLAYQLEAPLQRDPGSGMAYSNFGYFLLGRIIERTSGTGYEAFMQREVLTPAGVKSMRLGRSLKERRHPDEVDYQVERGREVPSVVSAGEVPLPYGGFNLENMDAHGGWVASAADLVRLVCQLDRPPAGRLLTEESLQAMWARPGYVATGEPVYYGCGWSVRPVQDGVNVWHSGSLPGTRSYLVRLANGIRWAVLFNRREGPDDADYGAAIDVQLNGVLRGIPRERWPAHDLF